MYDYRKMTAEQRREAVEYRRLRERPWHSPPHWEFAGLLQFMISSACYEHKHIIGVTPERMAASNSPTKSWYSIRRYSELRADEEPN
jgi:putative transposase